MEGITDSYKNGWISNVKKKSNNRKREMTTTKKIEKVGFFV